MNPAGQVGGPPTPAGQEFTYTITAQSRLVTEKEFGDIVVRENPDGSMVRLKDVARIELGAQTYSLVGKLNGKPSAVMAIYQLPGSNAIDAAKRVRALMEERKARFPADLDYAVSLDTTRAVSEGMREIKWTLGIALTLVIIVVFIFPARLEGVAHPIAGGSGFAHRHVCLFPAVRFFAEHAVAAGIGAGHRVGGG